MSFSPHPLSTPGCNSIQEQRDRWEIKRSRTAKQLVRTEQRYCQQLELVTTFFVEILKAKGTLKQDIRESIFSTIKAIHSANQSLLIHLENGYFGKGFDKFCSHLHHYNTYVDNIYNANKVLGIQLKKNKAFRHFKKLQEARPEFNNQKLEDLLQLPIQRIDQYKHFLEDLTSNTSPHNPEFEQLSRAVTAVCMVFQRIQDNTQYHENHLQLCRVQKLLKGRKLKVLAAGSTQPITISPNPKEQVILEYLTLSNVPHMARRHHQIVQIFQGWSLSLRKINKLHYLCLSRVLHHLATYSHQVPDHYPRLCQLPPLVALHAQQPPRPSERNHNSMHRT
ncbi:rho guanine nucleotide exchange factor 39 isoform X4 [Mugil cephalus]|uniref:rho guanine nucleotide exchange factor 39 isoform X4 n=1 Tax=Mugil cephalus TaxID=48193 RepID=UPI001FB70810|nr:rho guanine nucleotide exchange factor 39 isoform X4 [Mugil cephalus]